MIKNRTSTKDSVHLLLDAVDAISVQGYDEERKVTYWNRGSEFLYGYTEEEALGRRLEDLIIPEEMRDAVITAHKNWITEGVEIPAAELTLRNKTGDDVNVFSSHAFFINKKKKHEMFCIDIDLSEVKKAKDEAVFKENMLEAVFEATPDLFFLMEKDGTVIDYHAGDNKHLYVPPKSFIGKNISKLLPGKIADNFKKHIEKTINEQSMSSFEYYLDMPQGTVYFEARFNYLKTYQQVVIIVRDITEQHKSAETIKKHAYFDSLTLLPNRFLSLDRLTEMLKDAKRSNEKTAVLFLDLDDFKKVNDSLGHEVGDKILVEAANRLTLAVRQSDTVGRLGGDEFIILLRTLSDEINVIDISESLLNVFRKPFNIDGRELVLTLSIGIATYPENGDSASELLRNADTAMYQAKTSGRNTYSFFTKEMNDIMLRRFEIEEQLHNALENNELEVYYQPKYSVKDGSIVGAEALIRWHSPSLGNITPDEFIPIAEHTGLISPIGNFVIKEALEFLSTWRRTHKKDYTIAVNLSPRQFRDTDLIGFIRDSLENSEIKPESLEFEITEGLLMARSSYIDDTLKELHKLGVKLSMDDFGTGYSSLSYLRQYPFDILKIDRSFISGISLKKEDCDLVKATIAMAHSLALQVVAEGVELHEQLIILDSLGCDLVQGYYFSKPVPANELLELQDSSSDSSTA